MHLRKRQLKALKVKAMSKTNRAKQHASVRSFYKLQNHEKTGLHILGGGMSRIERQTKGHTWSKVKAVKWKSWTPTVKLLVKAKVVGLNTL